MNILIISDYRDSVNSVRPEGELFIGLSKLGHRISLMTYKNSVYTKEFLNAGICLIEYHPNKKISFEAIKKIRNEIKQGGYDILLLLNSKAISNGNFASIGLQIKVIAYRGVIGGSSWLSPNSYLKHLHPRVDGILALSKSVQKYIQKQIWWNPQKVKQLYKGQDISWFDEVIPKSPVDLGLPPNAFIVTCVANNRRWKGIRYLIESTNYLLPNLPIHFLLVGRNIGTQKNLKLIRESKYKDQIHILGFRTDVCEILAMSKVYVQPSLANKEGLGKAILEAMSLGVPPIVTNSGGPQEFVDHMVSGILVPPKNSKEIAKNILKLYKNEELRNSLGEASKSVIIERLNMENSISGLHQILTKIMETKANIIF